MSFFIRKLNKDLTKQGKRTKHAAPKGKHQAKRQKLALDDEEIESDDEIVDGPSANGDAYLDEDAGQTQNNNISQHKQDTFECSSDEADLFEEAAQEKKLRAAKKYLQEIKDITQQQEEDEQLDNDAINARLKEDVLKRLGTLYTKTADRYHLLQPQRLSDFQQLKNAHKLSITCLVVSADSKFIYSASKDATIVKWDLESGKKLKVIPSGQRKVSLKKKQVKNGGKDVTTSSISSSSSAQSDHFHYSTINAIALTSDSKYLATGDNDRLIHIWNPSTMEFVHKFKGHSGAITGLTFRKHDHTLYSISKDRSLRVWDLGTMCYMQTLFGHQETITSIDMLLKERALTSGGFDSTIRLWKVSEESQLVFNSQTASVDCVRYLDEQYFVSGSMNGTISLWSAQKKKPLYVESACHKLDQVSNTPNWIISIAAFSFSDVFATGSNDGYVRVWKHEGQKFSKLFEIPVVGFVNSLAFADDGKKLIVGVGQEHKLGRWQKIREARNRILIIPLRFK